MIEYHNCPHCKKEMKVWLPFEIKKPPVVIHDCGNEVDFQFVYDRREFLTLEQKELEQLRYLKKKYEI